MNQLFLCSCHLPSSSFYPSVSSLFDPSSFFPVPLLPSFSSIFHCLHNILFPLCSVRCLPRLISRLTCLSFLLLLRKSSSCHIPAHSSFSYPSTPLSCQFVFLLLSCVFLFLGLVVLFLPPIFLLLSSLSCPLPSFSYISSSY